MNCKRTSCVREYEEKCKGDMPNLVRAQAVNEQNKMIELSGAACRFA